MFVHVLPCFNDGSTNVYSRMGDFATPPLTIFLGLLHMSSPRGPGHFTWTNMKGLGQRHLHAKFSWNSCNNSWQEVQKFPNIVLCKLWPVAIPETWGAWHKQTIMYYPEGFHMQQHKAPSFLELENVGGAEYIANLVIVSKQTQRNLTAHLGHKNLLIYYVIIPGN